jgi:hypothetical protein
MYLSLSDCEARIRNEYDCRMKFTEKTKYQLLVLLVILNIILRLPVTPHGLQQDSFSMQARANFISSNGFADWILNPLSFFGLYPFSYPSGIAFFISEISQCTGIGMEWTVWLAAAFFGVLGVFTSYLMAKEINNDFLFAFAVAVVYSTSRLFICWTNWNCAGRGPFVALLPLFIWVILRYHNQKGNKLIYSLLALSMLITLGAIHHMIIFIPLILTVFGICSFLYIISKKINIQKLITPKISIVLFFTLFLPLLLLPFTSLGFYHSLESFIGGHRAGYFFHGSTPYHILLNMGAEYAMAVGISIVLAPIGLFSLLLKKQKTFSDAFLVSCMLCIVPFLADPVYIMIFILFIFSLLVGFGLIEMLKMLNKIKQVKNIAPIIMVLILLFSVLLPYFMTIRHVPSLPYHTYHMNELTYNSALFIKGYGVELPRISASASLLPRINAIAGPPYQHANSNELSKISSWEIEPISLSNFISDFLKYKSIYKAKTGYALFEYYECDSMSSKRGLGEKTYLVIEDNYMPGRLPFYVSTRVTRPKIYDDGLESIWYLSYRD